MAYLLRGLLTPDERIGLALLSNRKRNRYLRPVDNPLEAHGLNDSLPVYAGVTCAFVDVVLSNHWDKAERVAEIERVIERHKWH